MAFFKFRKGGDEQPTPPTASESVEAMRKRARHRLVGAAVLVLIGVVGFPLLFDSQPRPIAVDIPIEIPDKGKVRPLGAPPVPAATQSSGVVIEEREEPAAPAASTPAPKAAETKVAVTKPEPKPEPKPPAAKPEPKPEPKAEAKPEPKPEPKVEPKVEPKPEPKVETKPASEDPIATFAKPEVYWVQVAAVSDKLRADALASELSGKGFSAKVESANTGGGTVYRVRVGPISGQARADETKSKLGAAGYTTGRVVQ